MFVYILYMYVCIIYICQDGSAVGFVDFTKLLFALSSLAQPLYSRTLLRNTKPAQSLGRTFSRRNSRKKNRYDNKMAAPEASVHPVSNRLCYHFFLTKRTKVAQKVFQER